MNYLALSGVFLGIAILVAAIAIVVRVSTGGRGVSRMLPLIVTAVIVLGLTAVFDNVMIASGLFVYDLSRTSGVVIGRAPIEDFAYPVAALILLPALWSLLGRRRHGR